MIDNGDHEDGSVIEQIDWDNLLSNIPIPDDLSLVNDEWLSIEDFLMNDNDEQVVDSEVADRFFSDVFVDSPPDSLSDKTSDSEKVIDVPQDSTPDSFSDKTSDSEKVIDVPQEEHKVNDDVVVVDEEHNDPLMKKRKRQLRNKDAAVRSRERKKLYVRDLELKSKYFEAECRRLGMLLQCCVAENQALKLSLQSQAVGASMSKQESAVLFLESLLLGSLLWLMGIICLLIPPKNLQLTPLESGERLEILGPRMGRSEIFRNVVFKSFLMMGKKCKASRSRMKHVNIFPSVIC